MQVLAQVTTNITEMAARLQNTTCKCDPDTLLPADDRACTARYVCGRIHYQLSVVLMVMACIVVFLLAW
jgi:hypothetical protein